LTAAPATTLYSSFEEEICLGRKGLREEGLNLSEPNSGSMAKSSSGAEPRIIDAEPILGGQRHAAKRCGASCCSPFVSESTDAYLTRAAADFDVAVV